ncbi:MAG: hypothetical protein IPM82_10010 [Saprospiraceae bacterium]|nr:hypothetical protein [Saprospiraceae bacterium]
MPFARHPKKSPPLLLGTLEAAETEFVDQYFAARRIQRTGICHETPPTPNTELTENLASTIESMQTEPVPVLAENGVTV